MAVLSLSLLGSFAASLDGRSLTKFRTNKVQALLIYLAVENRQTHRRDFLMELLWPGLPQPSAQVNLRQTIHRLNQAIPALAAKEPGDGIHGAKTVPLLLSDRQSVQINPDSAYDLDVTAFTGLLKGEPTLEELTPAVALYRGDFLADFYLSDSSVFEEWAAAWRAATCAARC
jgi:DNA-binding SARP family transcriptional activator